MSNKSDDVKRRLRESIAVVEYLGPTMGHVLNVDALALIEGLEDEVARLRNSGESETRIIDTVDPHPTDAQMTPEELRSARDEMGLTQQRLADSTGHDIRTVQRWESGDSPIKPSMARLVRHWLAQHQRRAAK